MQIDAMNMPPLREKLASSTIPFVKTNLDYDTNQKNAENTRIALGFTPDLGMAIQSSDGVASVSTREPPKLYRGEWNRRARNGS